MNRRTFIAGGLGALALFAGGIFFAKGSLYRKAANRVHSLTEDLDARFLRQMVTADASRSRTIMWQAEEILTKPAIEYRLKGQEEVQRVPAQEDFFTDDGVENHQYLAELQELQSDADYEYRVVTDVAASDWHALHTPGTGSFECLIFPDSQSSDYSDWEALAQNAARHSPKAAFFINMGDIVDNGEDHTQWQSWFYGVEGIMDRMPFAPVMGNHETYDQNWQVRLPEAYLKYFVVPENGSRDFSRYYYSFDYGDVHFIVLNSQWDETEDFKPGLMEEQLNWLREDAGKSRKKWNIVLVHKDVLQYRIHNRPERQEGFSDVGRNFMPLFDELGIDLVFTAHLHTYRNRGHIKDFRRDGRGPLYILTGVAGNVRYPGLWVDHHLDEVVAPQPETDNYLTMQVTAQEITVKCFLPDGQEIDRVTVTKDVVS